MFCRQSGALYCSTFVALKRNALTQQKLGTIPPLDVCARCDSGRLRANTQWVNASAILQAYQGISFFDTELLPSRERFIDIEVIQPFFNLRVKSLCFS